eukprot:jgi/Ulvmu1/7421/UM036_0082.1
MVQVPRAMEVGAVSAVIEEFNVCMDTMRGLVSGYYRRQARKRSLRGELDRAQARVSESASAAARLDRLLVLEMAPLHFRVLQAAVAELRRRTEAVITEAARYAPRDADVAQARTALDEVAARHAHGRVSVESAGSAAAAALAAATPRTAASAAAAAAAQPPPPLPSATSPPEKGALAQLASQSKRVVARPLSLRRSRQQAGDAVQPNPAPGKHAARALPSTEASTSSDAVAVGCCGAPGQEASDSGLSGASRPGEAPIPEHSSTLSTAAASCWGRTRRAAGCVGAVVFPEVSEWQRTLLQDALGALEEACAAIEAARRQVRVAQRRQKNYVRPPLFADIVASLYDDPTPIVVISGAPALGKSALAQELRWLVNSQNQLSERFDRTAYYLCKDGVCDNPAEMFRIITEHSAEAETSNFDIWEDLADHVGGRSMLLVLDNLEDGACFHQHGALSALVHRLGTSKLIITTCNGKLCNVLPAARCFTLTRAENEEHVMFRLMTQLTRGTARRRDGPAASPAVMASIHSCVTQCQGSPQLLRLADAYVRLSIMPPDRRSAVDTMADAFAAQWRTCAEQLFPSAAAAQGEQANFGTYDRLNHHVYRRVLRQVTSATPAGGAAAAAQARTMKAALRAIIKLNSREWYAWEAVVSFVVAEEAAATPRASMRGAASSPVVASPAVSPAASACARTATPFGGTPRREGSTASDDSLGFIAWSDSLVGEAAGRSPFVAQQDHRQLADVDAALRLLVSHRILEAQVVHVGRGVAAAARLVRFHELLKECLTKCDEARALVGLPPNSVEADSEESTRQYFLSQFGSIAPDKWLGFFRPST